MANIKFSQFTQDLNVQDWDGFVGFESTTLSGTTNANYYIAPDDLMDYIGDNIVVDMSQVTTGILPIAQGGTGINPSPVATQGVPFVGALINEGSLVIGDQLVISADPITGNPVLNTISNSFSFMVTVNQGLGNIGYGAGAWNNAGWEYAPTGAFLKYTQTAANPKLRKSHFKEQEANCELEMTISLSGVSTATYDWELRLVDPLGVAATQVVTSSAAVGVTPTMNDFDSGAGTWGAGWQQVRVTGVNLTYFADPSLPTEGELELYINGTSGWANVGCSCRFMSN
jgi:hypothetical protein